MEKNRISEVETLRIYVVNVMIVMSYTSPKCNGIISFVYVKRKKRGQNRANLWKV